MTPHQVIAPAADVREMPDREALRGRFETQLVFGEIFNVAEEKDGWCKGTCAHDGYAGYVEKQHLSPKITPATHIVTAARSHIYRDADIKSPLVATLGFGSAISLIEETEKYARLDTGEWLYKQDVSSTALLDRDYAATAKKFLETPYYWGGRSGFGIDCSGLVQVCLARAGIPAPRDTEQQINAVGEAAGMPKKGDIVFFPAHVGIMTDDANMIHANAFHMKVTIEPVEIVSARGGKITAVRRLPGYPQS